MEDSRIGSGAAQMTIRQPLQTDSEKLVDLWLRSVRATHDFLTESDIQTFLPFVREYLSSPETDLWVLCSDVGAVIGFMGMSGSRMEALFIDPEHHRCGGGRRLVEHAKQLHGELTVDVNEQNPGACRFYESCGFVVEGRSPVDGMGKPFPLLHLRLKSP
jgi:putative acetyltransferase